MKTRVSEVLGDLLSDVRELEANNEAMQAKLGTNAAPSERRPLSIEETEKAHKLLDNASIASGRIPDRIANLVEVNKRCEEEMVKAQREVELYRGRVEEARRGDVGFSEELRRECDRLRKEFHTERRIANGLRDEAYVHTAELLAVHKILEASGAVDGSIPKRLLKLVEAKDGLLKDADRATTEAHKLLDVAKVEGGTVCERIARLAALRDANVDANNLFQAANKRLNEDKEALQRGAVRFHDANRRLVEEKNEFLATGKRLQEERDATVAELGRQIADLKQQNENWKLDAERLSVENDDLLAANTRLRKDVDAADKAHECVKLFEDAGRTGGTLQEQVRAVLWSAADLQNENKRLQGERDAACAEAQRFLEGNRRLVKEKEELLGPSMANAKTQIYECHRLLDDAKRLPGTLEERVALSIRASDDLQKANEKLRAEIGMALVLFDEGNQPGGTLQERVTRTIELLQEKEQKVRKLAHVAHRCEVLFNDAGHVEGTLELRAREALAEIESLKKELGQAAASLKEAADVFDAAGLPQGSFAYRLNGLRVNYLSGKAERHELRTLVQEQRAEIDGAHNLLSAKGFKADGTLLERIERLASTVDLQNETIRKHEAEARECDKILCAGERRAGTIAERVRDVLHNDMKLAEQFAQLRSEGKDDAKKVIETAHVLINETDVPQGPIIGRLTTLIHEYQQTREDRKILDLFRSALVRTEAR